MKQILFLLTSTLFVTLTVQAQQKQSKFMTELSFGPSLPIGRFAATSTNGDKKAAGYAKPGLGLQLSAGYYLNRSFGLLVSAGYATHPQNKQARRESLTRAGLKINNIDCENWKELKLMAGGFYITPVGTKLSLITKLTAGVCKTGIPKINGSGIDTVYMAPAIIQTDKKSLPWAFCYQASAGLQYKLSQKWYALVDVSYFNATAVNKYTYTTYSLSPQTTVIVGPTVSGKAKYGLATINALVGVGVNF